MGIAVAGYDGLTLAVRAPLPPNRNLHGTVFAGRLFSVCALTGWGAVWLALRERGQDGVIFAADSRWTAALTFGLTMGGFMLFAAASSFLVRSEAAA